MRGLGPARQVLARAEQLDLAAHDDIGELLGPPGQPFGAQGADGHCGFRLLDLCGANRPLRDADAPDE
ncbi:hypothetical protein [Nocardia asteroides]